MSVRHDVEQNKSCKRLTLTQLTLNLTRKDVISILLSRKTRKTTRKPAGEWLSRLRQTQMSCSKPIQALSFAEIIKGRDSSVRVFDGMLYAVDLVVVMTGLNRNESGCTLRRLTDKQFSSINLIEKNTGGSGNSRTKLVSFQHALELIMVLPGDEAKRTRVQFADILKRYMAGDKSLIAEIDANAESNSPIPQMARASLATEPVEKPTLMDLKRKRAELECAKLEVEIKSAAYEHITKVANSYSELCEGKVMDERARKIFKDNLLSKAMLQAEPSSTCTTNSKPVVSPIKEKAAEPIKKLSDNVPVISTTSKKLDVFKPSVGYYEMNDCGCYENNDDDDQCDEDRDYPPMQDLWGDDDPDYP